MTILIILSVVWVAVLVLALVVYLSLTAYFLHRAKLSVAKIADDLETVASGTEPLNELVGEVAEHVGAIGDDMAAVDAGLRQVLAAVTKQPALSATELESGI